MNSVDIIAIAKRELERRNKISATKTGVNHSETTKQKMREAWVRRKARNSKSVGIDATGGEK